MGLQQRLSVGAWSSRVGCKTTILRQQYKYWQTGVAILPVLTFMSVGRGRQHELGLCNPIFWLYSKITGPPAAPHSLRRPPPTSMPVSQGATHPFFVSQKQQPSRTFQLQIPDALRTGRSQQTLSQISSPFPTQQIGFYIFSVLFLSSRENEEGRQPPQSKRAAVSLNRFIAD